MGGQVKAALSFAGRPLAAWSADALAPHCSAVMLATGRLPGIAQMDLPCLPDHFPGFGPLAGFHAGLLVAGDAGILVLPCDLPLLRAEHLAPLLAHRADHDVVIFEHQEGIEPLVGWYGPRCLPVMYTQLLAGGGSIRAAYAKVRVQMLPWAFARSLLQNVNTPADLAAAEALIPLEAPAGQERTPGAPRSSRR